MTNARTTPAPQVASAPGADAVSRPRDYRLDNMRSVLICLVVLCHVLVQSTGGPITRAIYHTVYVFHMPAFVFVTGYFARFRPKRVAAGMLLPYVVFQLVAIVRRNLVAGRVWSAGLTLLDPQWTLWYLLACVLWYATVPMLRRVSTRRAQAGVVVGALVASLAVGFVPWVGSALDLSRVVAYFPFFCAGFYAGGNRLSERVGAMDGNRRRRLVWECAVAIVALMGVYWLAGPFGGNALYRNGPYAQPIEVLARAFTQVTAGVWCVLLFVGSTSRNRGFVTVVGQNTLSVYLLHTWAIRLWRHVLPLPGGEAVQVLMCVCVSAAMVAATGNRRVGSAFKYVFGGFLQKPKRV